MGRTVTGRVVDNSKDLVAAHAGMTSSFFNLADSLRSFSLTE